MTEPAPSGDAAPADPSEIGYGAALAELEGILDEIEDDAVDVDVLAARVKRAAELLRVCRDRITAARIEVTQIVADLDPGAMDDGTAADDAG
ncbi:MAG: exodeoxyribonuclease VII small subunit [Actinomycetota bacterium]